MLLLYVLIFATSCCVMKCQTCIPVLQTCSNCFITSTLDCRNIYEGVTEQQCLDMFDSSTSHFATYAENFRCSTTNNTCSQPMYKPSTRNTTTYRYECPSECNAVKLVEVNNVDILSASPVLTINVNDTPECMSHCVEAAFIRNPSTCVYNKDNHECKIYTSPYHQFSTTTSLSSHMYGVICLEQCYGPVPLGNGTIVLSSGSEFGSTATYTCNTGYNLNPANQPTRTCQNNALWDGVEARCDPVDCGPLPEHLNGNLTVHATTYLSQARYTCNDGYLLSGVDTLTCGDAEEIDLWNGDPPHCRPIGCADPPEAANGNFTVETIDGTSYATYTCYKGFVSTDTMNYECPASGSKKWTPSVAPTCNPLTCNDPPSMTDCTVQFSGTGFNDMATYTCTGVPFPVNKTCQSDQRWYPDINCGALSDIINGVVNYTSIFDGSVASFYCNHGYLLDGNNQSTCLPNGDWDNPNPSCNIIDCGTPPSINPNCTVQNNGTIYQSLATYSCSWLSVSVVKTCGIDQQWFPNINCEPLGDMANGFVNYSGIYNGSVATFGCDPGCFVVGRNNSFCLGNGSWSDPAPTCSCVLCPALNNPDNGTVTTSDTTNIGSVATYRCNYGYVLSGTASRTCSINGNWTSSEPVCNPRNLTQLNWTPIYLAPCLCQTTKAFANMTQEQIVKQLVIDTLIDAKKTSKEQQKLMCMEDGRESSKLMGTVGLTIILVVFGLVVFLDALTLICRCRFARLAKKRRSAIRKTENE